MSWKRSIDTAVRALKRGEQDLKKELAAVQKQIVELELLAREARGGKPGARAAGKQRLSPKGRAAISRAAKARWVRYRAEQRRQARPRA